MTKILSLQDDDIRSFFPLIFDKIVCMQEKDFEPYISYQIIFILRTSRFQSQ